MGTNRDPQPDDMQKVRDLVALSPKWMSPSHSSSPGSGNSEEEKVQSVRSREDGGH